VNGFSGCNKFFGSATLSDHKLHFSPLAGTRMMCAETMSFESKVLSNLAKISSYKIEVKLNVETLYLYHNKTEFFSFRITK
jgi:heat shock protein HslJ